MAVENTDLERRVLAHEQILQSLLAQMEGVDPGFLDELKEKFGRARRGSGEHDFTETADYAEQFIHEVARLQRTETQARTTAPPVAAERASPEGGRFVGPDSNTSAAITTRTRSGVWQVTRDEAFIGDYRNAPSALDASIREAQAIERKGGSAHVTFGPVR